MLFNKLTYPLIFAVFLIAGLIFIATPATAQGPIPVAVVKDENDTLENVQIHAFTGATITFELVIMFQDNPDVTVPNNIAVTGFDVDDIKLQAADSNGIIVPGGATAAPVEVVLPDTTLTPVGPLLDVRLSPIWLNLQNLNSVYKTTVTVQSGIYTVLINIPAGAASTLGKITPLSFNPTDTKESQALPDQLVIQIVRRPAPPLTLSEDRTVNGAVPFAVTLTSTAAITLTAEDFKVGGGSVDSVLPDTTRKVWTATIRPGVGVTAVTVEPADGMYTFPKGTFTIGTADPNGAGLPLDVIFSEIANRNNNANEWIEFKNASSTSQNVGDWTVSILTAVDSDELLFSLPNVIIPAGGVLLVTDKEPADAGSSLEQGKNSPLWRQVDIGALPNEGNFILILRKTDDEAHLGTTNHIVDVAGYFRNAAHATALIGHSPPSVKNNLKANRVYWRQHEDIIGTSAKGITNAEAAFQPIGFTGIGYERAAAPTDENGGTPGYPNDIRYGDVRYLTGDVTISEIMFTTNGNANEAQWIELYNGSKTEAVALDANDGWRLIIDNYVYRNPENGPVSGEIHFKNNGSVKTILPNQTVLIVSSQGRNSNEDHFPSSRVFDVYAEVGKEFNMENKRDPFLNPTLGFYIKLVDGNDRITDEVGNLSPSARPRAAPAWKLPNGRTEEGDRTSMIRRYRTYRGGRYFNHNTVHVGTERDGWILAANTDFQNFSRNNLTWYGSETDYGTPGLRAGQALPVQLSQFRPNLTDAGTVVINWMTESELNNAGFNILRSQTRTGEFKVINTQLIPGAGTTAERNTYTWTDTTAKPNVIYYYQIEDVSFDGERQTLATVRLRGLISAKGKLTTQWGELKRSRN